ERAPVKLEAVGGAVPLDSAFYIVRPTDDDFLSAIAREDSIVLIKGARQMGKTSLLARGLSEARKSRPKVVLTDFQKLNAAHNERSLDPAGPWQKLTMAIAYAMEAQLFITNIKQSPFNVGTRLYLEDFTPEQVAELNRRYGHPLKNTAELSAFYELLGGHPYL